MSRLVTHLYYNKSLLQYFFFLSSFIYFFIFLFLVLSLFVLGYKNFVFRPRCKRFYLTFYHLHLLVIQNFYLLTRGIVRILTLFLFAAGILVRHGSDFCFSAVLLPHCSHECVFFTTVGHGLLHHE